MDLHVFDCSNYIYSGPRNNVLDCGVYEEGSRFKMRSIPCGGVSYLLNAVFEWKDEYSDLVFCFDSPPEVKKRMFIDYFAHDGYKGNRFNTRKDIPYQKELAENLMRELGFMVLSSPGYEADDLIASVVLEYKDSYEKVYIHTKDSDLYYLVDNTVEILPLVKNVQKVYGQQNKNNNGKHIHMRNWEESVVSGSRVPYDLLTIRKMCVGETGDGIPRISDSMANIICQNVPRDAFPKCGDNTYLRKFIKDVTNNHEHTMVVADLIMPIILPQSEIQLYECHVDEEAFRYAANTLGNKYAKHFKPIVVEGVKDVFEKAADKYNGRC